MQKHELGKVILSLCVFLVFLSRVSRNFRALRGRMFGMRPPNASYPRPEATHAAGGLIFTPLFFALAAISSGCGLRKKVSWSLG